MPVHPDTAVMLAVLRWGIACLLAVHVAVTVLAILWRRVPAAPDGATTLHVGTAYLAMPVISAIIPVTVLVVSSVLPPGKDPGTVSSAVGGLLLMGLLLAFGFLGFLEGLSGAGWFNDTAVYQYSPIWGSRRLEWGEVTKVILHPSGSIVLRAPGGRSITFSHHWSGLGPLREMAKQKAQRRVQSALDVLEERVTPRPPRPRADDY